MSALKQHYVTFYLSNSALCSHALRQDLRMMPGELSSFLRALAFTDPPYFPPWTQMSKWESLQFLQTFSTWPPCMKSVESQESPTNIWCCCERPAALCICNKQSPNPILRALQQVMSAAAVCASVGCEDSGHTKWELRIGVRKAGRLASDRQVRQHFIGCVY